jgi:hypothetical protein
VLPAFVPRTHHRTGRDHSGEGPSPPAWSSIARTARAAAIKMTNTGVNSQGLRSRRSTTAAAAARSAGSVGGSPCAVPWQPHPGMRSRPWPAPECAREPGCRWRPRRRRPRRSARTRPSGDPRRRPAPCTSSRQTRPHRRRTPRARHPTPGGGTLTGADHCAPLSTRGHGTDAAERGRHSHGSSGLLRASHADCRRVRMGGCRSTTGPDGDCRHGNADHDEGRIRLGRGAPSPGKRGRLGTPAARDARLRAPAGAASRPPSQETTSPISAPATPTGTRPNRVSVKVDTAAITKATTNTA